MTGGRRVRLCGAQELAVGEARRFESDAGSICLVRCDAGFRAVADTCSHEDFSLSEGEVDPGACEIECWKHGSMFSLVTGEPVTLPATRPVAVFAVTVEGDDVLVTLP
ncbi:MAG TPA: non-heme iron oxygenase ferredoxin subunit [Acidimicrobiales bacterium]|nr:non-heme iron oxygenase ferredoxin subunit [Acidimicrobiales bacterium]